MEQKALDYMSEIGIHDNEIYMQELGYSKPLHEMFSDFASKQNEKTELKTLELTVDKSKYSYGMEDVNDVYFRLTLVVDKQNRLMVYNTKADGDWREDADCDTLLVRDVILRV